MTNKNHRADAQGFKNSRHIDKDGEKVRAMFAEIAPRYDLMNRVLSLRTDERWRRTVVARVPPDRASQLPILDLATGTGDLALAYAKRFPGLKVIGADFCAPMLDRAKSKAAAAKAAVEFIEADGLALPFADHTFHLVSIAFGLRNMADADLGLAEMYRVLAPGGRLAVLEFSTPTLPGLRQAYRWYFLHVLPRIGRAAAPNKHNAYEYLPASVLAFPEGAELVQRIESAGFVQARFDQLTFGVATLYVAQKPGLLAH